MKNFIDIFDDYGNAFVKKLEFDNNGDWNMLDSDEQEIAAIWKFIVDVYNGGFEQFFLNWGYTCYRYAMRGFQRMGCREILELCHRTYMDVFDKFKDDKRLKSYWDIADYLEEEDDKILDALDDAIYDGLGEKVCETAYKFYHEELKKKA